LAAYDTGRARVFGHCAASTGIKPFMALVEQVMTREPYASATRVFWIVDNGSSHRGQAAIDRLAKRFPNAVMVHTPRHASWLNQTPHVAARLRGCCTPTRTAAAALTLATGADAATLTRLSVGDLAPDASTVRLDDQTVELPAYARSLVRALLVERATTLPHQPLFVYASGQYTGLPLQAAALARDLARIAQHAAVTLPGQHPDPRRRSGFAGTGSP
jgi:hypothetical protein